MKKPSEEIRKITVNLPASLIDKTMAHSDMNLSETIREALRRYNHARACDALMALRGKIPFDLTYEQIKEDRE